MRASPSPLERLREERAGRQDAGAWPSFRDAGLTHQRKAEPESMVSLGLDMLGVRVGSGNELMAEGKGSEGGEIAKDLNPGSSG